MEEIRKRVIAGIAKNNEIWERKVLEFHVSVCTWGHMSVQACVTDGGNGVTMR